MGLDCAIPNMDLPYDALELPKAIQRAVIDDDMETFRDLLFTESPAGTRMLGEDVAPALGGGFFRDVIGANLVQYESFVSLCMTHDRARYVREVMACERESGAPKAATFQLLCTVERGDFTGFSSPLEEIRRRASPFFAFEEYVSMTLEYMPDDPALARERDSGGEPAAVITWCDMQLVLRDKLAAPCARAAPAAGSTRSHRRSL